MKRVIVLATIMIAVLSFGLIQHVNAGGGGFTTLSFPNANRRSCGFWQVSGGGGQTVSNWVMMYSLVDGYGRLLANGAVTQFPTNGTIRGSFDTKPAANPIHFMAVGFYQGEAYRISDLYANDPCLSPSTNPTATLFVPSPVPTTTPINPPTEVPNPTPIPPNVWVGCSQTIIEGYVAYPIANSIRAEVSLASDLNVKLASQVVPLNGNTYDVTLSYPEQPANTQLVVAVGEWDGSQYVHPAYLTGAPCIAGAATPVPTLPPTLSPTLPPTLPPTVLPTVTPIVPTVIIGCSQTTVQGYITNAIASNMRIAVNLASDLSINLGSVVVPISGYSYGGTVTYPAQPLGTHLIVSVGEWNGTNYVRQAYLTGGDCTGGNVPMPTPTAPIPTNTPLPTVASSN